MPHRCTWAGICSLRLGRVSMNVADALTFVPHLGLAFFGFPNKIGKP
jgi:hypothetical protein